MKRIIISLLLACAILFSGCIQYVPDDQMPNAIVTKTLVKTPIPTIKPNITRATPQVTTILPTVVITPTATATPKTFPYALKLGSPFVFGSETIRSLGTVYRYKELDNYTWRNDELRTSQVQQPSVGNKYLFVFLNIENIGVSQILAPTEKSVAAVWDNQIMPLDPHRNANNWIEEVYYLKPYSNGANSRYFGWRGTTINQSEYIYPGKSNAQDGYLIFEVPKALNPQETIIAINFNTNDHGFWVLG
jgi:hypothetical protein